MAGNDFDDEVTGPLDAPQAAEADPDEGREQEAAPEGGAGGEGAEAGGESPTGEGHDGGESAWRRMVGTQMKVALRALGKIEDYAARKDWTDEDVERALGTLEERVGRVRGSYDLQRNKRQGETFEW